MTACGVGTLLIAKHVLSTRHPEAWGAENSALVDRAVLDGFAWLDLHWDAAKNSPPKTYDGYYLYCVERAMDLAGATRLGNHVWYVEVAKGLVERQRQNGSWDTKSGGSPILDTAFSLLVLRRATAPVTVSSEAPPTHGK